MNQEEIDVSRFDKVELVNTLEKLFMGYFISDLADAIESDKKNELVMNYMAIKKLINQSEAG
jgi:hypothetical protein